MLLFAWKAAVFHNWGLGLFAVAVAVIASHVMLPFSRFSWRSKGLLSVSAAIIAGGLILGGVWFGFEPLRRPFDLFRANLSGQWLTGEDLRGARLSDANLSGADLSGANLFGANLRGATLNRANLNGSNPVGANLSGANLSDANLSGAHLFNANLGDANLSGADLSGADLSRASLSDAKNVTPTQLDEACGNAETKLPEGLTIKPCP
jgi:uncharacterized protein YjbI with pentapeptide repeats